MNTLAFGIGSLGTWDMLVLLLLGLLLFGKKLPEVGKSLGRGIVEFKKGLKGVEDDIEVSSERKDSNPYREQLPPYKQPNSGGQDVRVSRSDPADASPHGAEPGQPVSSGHAEGDTRTDR